MFVATSPWGARESLGGSRDLMGTLEGPWGPSRALWDPMGALGDPMGGLGGAVRLPPDALTMLSQYNQGFISVA